MSSSKTMLCVVALMSAGCTAVAGSEATAGQLACESNGGVRWHWPSMTRGEFKVTCMDGTEVKGKVKE